MYNKIKKINRLDYILEINNLQNKNEELKNKYTKLENEIRVI